MFHATNTKHFETYTKHFETFRKVFVNFNLFIMGSLTPWGAAIDATASHINLGAQMIYNHQEAKLQREWQSKENQRSRDFEERMWNLSNAYNTPSAQRQRLEEAGLNPYLGTGEIGAGQTAPMSAPAPQGGVPAHPISPVSTNFAGAFAQMESLRNQSKAVDANASNQNAEALLKSVEGIGRMIKEFNMSPSEARSFYLPFIRSTIGNDWENSVQGRRLNLEVDKLAAEKRVADVNAQIAERNGIEISDREKWKLDYEYQESVARVNLWSTIADLNRSNVKVNDAKIQDLIASAFNHWQNGKYVKELSLTESERREWFVANLMCDFLVNHADAAEAVANEAANKKVYEEMKGEDWQNRQWYGECLNQTYTSKTADWLLDKANKALVLQPARAALKRQYHDVKIEQNGLNPQGYKTKRTDSYYYDY